jgi:hypothetical protein
MLRQISRTAVILGTICFACAGCGFLSLEPPPPRLGISNGTTLVVTVVVNGRQVGAVQPRSGMDPVDPTLLPPLPWIVEARSESGRLLTWMTVTAGQVSTTRLPDGTASMSGTLGRVDLSCGRFDMWAGDFPASGPIPGPGLLGDCDP